MESGLIQIWLVIKWFVFAAIGSGLSVIIDKTENTWQKKILLFICGALISIIGGGALIEFLVIKGGAVQGFIYWAFGLWGMGLVIQLTQQMPIIISNLRDKYTK